MEVNRFNKGVGKLYGIDTPLYNQKLGEALERLDVSLQDKTIAFTRYCSTERGKLLVIVLDNCDKRLRNEQLLMFEAAQWVQKGSERSKFCHCARRLMIITGTSLLWILR